MAKVTITRQVARSPDEVWAVLQDFTHTPGPPVVVEVEAPGDPDKGGVGAIRRVTIGSIHARERLESLDPASRSLVYSMLSGAPVKTYHATVAVRPDGDHTVIDWNVEFTPKVPGIGWLVGRVLRGVVGRFLDAVAAPRQGTGAPPACA